MRTHLAVSMVCMVNATAVHEGSNKPDMHISRAEPSQCHGTAVNETQDVIKGYKVGSEKILFFLVSKNSRELLFGPPGSSPCYFHQDFMGIY